MPKIFLPFGKLSPDLGHFNNPGMLDVRNVIPLSGKYVAAGGNTVKAAIGTVAATAGNAPLTRGIHAHSKGAGGYDVYVGRQTSLKKFDPAAAWAQTDVSRTVGGAYNCLAAGGENGWQFCSSGGTVIATNGVDAVQAKLPGAATFENLFTSTKKPLAKFVMMVNENLVCCNTNDAGTAQPRRAWWTQSNAFQNIGDRVTNPTFIGTGFQDLEDELGHITGCIGMGGYGVIFKEEGIVLMSGPEYRFDKIRGYGLIYPNAIDALGEDIYFWSGGPCRMRNGSVERIGETTLWRTLHDSMRQADSILTSYLTYDSREHAWCRADQISGRVFWGITTIGRAQNPGTSSTLAYQQGNLWICLDTTSGDLTWGAPWDDAYAVGNNRSIGLPYLIRRPQDAARPWTPGSAFLAVQRVAGFGGDTPADSAWDDSIVEVMVDPGPPEFFPTLARNYAAIFELPYSPLSAGSETGVLAYRPIYRLKDGVPAGELLCTIDRKAKARTYEAPVQEAYSNLVAAGASTGDGWIHSSIDASNRERKEFHAHLVSFYSSEDESVVLTDVIEFEGIEVEYDVGGTARKS